MANAGRAKETVLGYRGDMRYRSIEERRKLGGIEIQSIKPDIELFFI